MNELFENRKKTYITIEWDMLEELAKTLIQSVREEEKGVNPKRMSRKQLQQYLLDRGFKVRSSSSLQTAIEDLGLEPEKRGRQHWFYTSQVKLIQSIVPK